MKNRNLILTKVFTIVGLLTLIMTSILFEIRDSNPEKIQVVNVSKLKVALNFNSLVILVKTKYCKQLMISEDKYLIFNQNKSLNPYLNPNYKLLYNKDTCEILEIK